MKGLVLVDLDNLTPSPKDRLPAPGQLALEGVPPQSDVKLEGLIVCFGMNTRTAQRLDLSWLDAFAARLQQLVAPTAKLGPLEVGVVLVMPDTADDLLVRLVNEAGRPQNAGTFNWLWLVSGDKGLHRRVTNCVGDLNRNKDGIFVWAKATFKRTFRQPAEVPTSGQPVRPNPLTRPVDCESVRTWAATVQASGPLSELAGRMEVEPWLSTQLGPTRRSLGGVHRLGEVLAGRAPALLCDFDDGVEVLTGSISTDDWMPLRPPDDVAPASTGPGAVIACWATENVRAMLRSRLPWWLVAELVKAQVTLSLGRAAVIDDTTALLLGPTELTIGRVEAVRIKLYKRGHGAGARVVAELDAVDDAWWWVPIEGELRCLRKLSIPASPHQPLEIEPSNAFDAQLTRVQRRGGPELVCRSPVKSGAVVTVGRRVSANQIGLATAEDGTLCALLALGAPITGEVEVDLIHNVRASVLQAASQSVLGEEQVEGLRRLPLVVPAPALAQVR